MKIYLLICTCIFIMFYAFIYSKMNAYRKSYPMARFKKYPYGETFIKFILTYFFFCIPVLNVVILYWTVFNFTEEQWLRIIENSLES